MGVLLEFIIVNTILVSIWLLIRLIRRRDIKFAIMLYLVPGLGFLVYYMPRWAFFIKKKVGYDRDSLVNRIPVDKTVEAIDLEEAFRIVPMQDILIEGSDVEKRHLLLNRLKKDIDSSYDTIKEAKDDQDSESVHYVSSVRMELYNKLNQRLQDARAQFKKIQDLEKKKENKGRLLQVLAEFIHSDLLQEVEKKIYMEEFCDLFETTNRSEYSDAYNDYMEFICNLNLDEKIRNELQEKNVELWIYETYNILLAYFFTRKEKETFYWLMNHLKKSSILLDERGIELIRFWKEGEKNNVVH